MKKLVLGAAIVALAAGPAAAAITTVEFTPTEGEKQVWKFNDQTNKATGPSGTEYDYTFDAEARQICASLPEGALCATFEGGAGDVTVGASASYSATNGSTGTATVLSIEE